MCSAAARKKPKKPSDLLMKPADFNRSVSGIFICVNLPGGTILPRFLFQKRYVNDATCQLPATDSYRRPSANDSQVSDKTV